ncbi:MAG: helix-turn-helix domain-containing protein [Truepera sp.]|jgi:DNA-binding transcriptional ArsR family regulator|nr:helix-turn-helix domain-containing protein [Truepera sp.]
MSSSLVAANAAASPYAGGLTGATRAEPSRSADPDRAADAFWKALASPWRRQILDALRGGPLTTGELAEHLPKLSRFAVMQHLDVLTDAGIVLVERRGRHRFNHINAAPLRGFYERWVGRFADAAASEMTALKRHLEEEAMANESVRVIRMENELGFAAPPERVFAALTDAEQVLKWFPYTYGEKRVQRVVLEPRVGGAQYEDWGDGRGYFYGHVTEWDPPRRYAVRSRLHAGTVMDTALAIEATEAGSVLRSSRVIVGPIDDEQERGIRFHGDLGRFEEAIRKVVEGERA